MTPEPEGWRSTDRRREDGAIDSVQRICTARPAVDSSVEGARHLGLGYWLEVSAVSRGLVRSRQGPGGVELLLLGLRPPLLAFAPAQVATGPGGIECSYRISGGLLARRPGGTLAVAQTRGELRVEVTGFSPRLGRLYGTLQRPFHLEVSRRYLGRLAAEARR